MIGREIVDDLLGIDALNYTELQAIKIRRDVDHNIRRLNKLAAKHSRILIPDAYKQARKASTVSLEILGNKKDSKYDPKTDQHSIDNAESQMLGYMVKANNSIRITANQYLMIMKKIADSLLQLQEFGGLTLDEEAALLESIEGAVERGDAQGKVYRNIRNYLKLKLGDTSLINIKGKYWRIDKYSKLVARTEMRRSQSQAVKNACNQWQNDLVQVSNHGTLTIICKPYEGNTYSISGNNRTYEYLDAEPPFHPNCMHFIIPTSEEAIAFTGEDRF